jgi:hypothetical protein
MMRSIGHIFSHIRSYIYYHKQRIQNKFKIGLGFYIIIITYTFHAAEDSVPYVQKPATVLYPETYKPSPHSHTSFLYDPF